MPHFSSIAPPFLNILALFLTTLAGSAKDMDYETFIKEGQHLKTLLTFTKLTKKERASTRKELEQLFDHHIFYPISTWPPSIKEILEHNTITDRSTFKLILFAYGYGISPNIIIEYLYTFILNTPSEISILNTPSIFPLSQQTQKQLRSRQSRQASFTICCIIYYIHYIRGTHKHKHHSPYSNLTHTYLSYFLRRTWTLKWEANFVTKYSKKISYH